MEDERGIMSNPYSAVKIFYHKEILDLLRDDKTVNPIYIRIKPTNFCNHHCSYCTYGSGNTEHKTSNRDAINNADMIPHDKMMEILGDIARMGTRAITFSGGGEPLTYPYLLEAVEMVKKNNIDLSLISNGQLLENEIAEAFYDAKWVRISFDSPNASEYAKIRGINERAFQSVTSNIQNFARKKSSSCVLGVNYVVGRHNYKRVYEAAKLLRDLGVDNVKFAAVVDNDKNYHATIKDETIDQIRRAKEEFDSGSFQVINNYENDWNDRNFSTQDFSICYTCRIVTVIGADQKLYLCHTRAYDSNAIVGDIRDRSLYDVWNSKETQTRLLELRPQTECRNFCAYKSRNEMIQAYFDVNVDHVNFI